jgi:hypothetical protein
MKRDLIWFFAPAAIFVVVALVALVAPRQNQPYCPTEDSCRPQYSDGGWTIEEVQP